jgi:hypothetical protein
MAPAYASRDARSSAVFSIAQYSDHHRIARSVPSRCPNSSEPFAKVDHRTRRERIKPEGLKNLGIRFSF